MRTSRQRQSICSASMSVRSIVGPTAAMAVAACSSIERSNAENSLKSFFAAASIRIRPAREAFDFLIAGLALAQSRDRLAQAFVDERRNRLAAFGRQIKTLQCGGDHLGRRRFELEQQAQRFGEVAVRKIAEDRAGRPAVEEPRQNCPLQERSSPILRNREHGAGELAEHDAREMAVERRKEHRDVRELLFERPLARLVADRIIVSQAEQHRGHVRRVVDEDREVDERQGVPRGARFEPHPAFFRRIEVLRRPRRRSRVATLAIAVDQIPHVCRP